METQGGTGHQTRKGDTGEEGFGVVGFHFFLWVWWFTGQPRVRLGTCQVTLCQN
jgi:hypothetical protein